MNIGRFNSSKMSTSNSPGPYRIGNKMFSSFAVSKWCTFVLVAFAPTLLLAQKQPMMKKESKVKSAKIVFLGDSITQAGARPGGYVDLVAKRLKGQLGATVVGAGISGNKVPDLQRRLQKDVLDLKPTHVVIYIGINDVWHSQSGNGTSPAKFKSGLLDIIKRIENSGAKPILCTPTVIGEKPLGGNRLDEKLELFSQITRSIAQKNQLSLVDLRQEMMDYLESQPSQSERKNAWLLTTDGVHMNQKGNHWLANQFSNKLPSMIGEGNGKLLRHIVLFKFKKEVSAGDVDKIVTAFTNLPAEIQEIADYESGTNNSPEKLEKGFTHAFLVSFKTVKERDLYLPHPSHKKFVKLLGGKLDDVLVFDFIDKK